MDQRTPGLIPHPSPSTAVTTPAGDRHRGDGDGDGDGNHRADSDRLREDIAAIRDNLGGLIGELDRRRHEAFDVRLQLRRHPIPVAVTALALAGLIGGVIAARVIRRRRRDRLVPRLIRIRKALGRLVRDPDHVAAMEPAPRKMGLSILSSAATAAAGIAAKRLVGQGRSGARRSR
jgi:hypothetical protein